jgi:hypothetical protein
MLQSRSLKVSDDALYYNIKYRRSTKSKRTILHIMLQSVSQLVSVQVQKFAKNANVLATHSKRRPILNFRSINAMQNL